MTASSELNRTILLCRDYVAGGLSDEEICAGFGSLRVLCLSDRRNLSSHSGQTALVTLVSLLNRMGMQVGLAFPDVAMLAPQPPLSGTSVREALIASSQMLLSGASVCVDRDFCPDIVFVLGDAKVENASVPVWRLGGGAWSGALALDGNAKTNPWTALWPIGSMVSAALGAGEAFKFVMRRLPFRDESDRIFFEPSTYCDWSFGPVPVAPEGVFFNEVDIISAGAICQAALYALLRLPKCDMWGRVFDDDATGASNLNRNMLTLVADVGMNKAQLVSRRCGANLRLAPISDRFVGLTPEIGKLAPRVLVGVDDIPSRWEVQRSKPNWAAVGGTSHFSVSSSDHSANRPCCGCLHPLDDPGGANPIPTASFISFWAGLAMAVRLIRAALASPYSCDRQHLWLTPLRMDLPHAAIWSPVAIRRDCPVACAASRPTHTH